MMKHSTCMMEGQNESAGIEMAKCVLLHWIMFMKWWVEGCRSTEVRR